MTSNTDEKEGVWKEIEEELETGTHVNLPPPASPVKASEVSAQTERVQIVGKVVELDEKRLLLDDGTGTIQVLFEDPSTVENIESGSTVRVFGPPLSSKEGVELHAEIIQRLDKLDLELYREIREEIKKFENIVKDKRRDNQ